MYSQLHDPIGTLTEIVGLLPARRQGGQLLAKGLHLQGG